jgi:hypothetical protein
VKSRLFRARERLRALETELATPTAHAEMPRRAAQ